MINYIIKKRWLRNVVIVVLFFLIFGFLVIIYNTANKNDLDCIAVNDLTGDIALSYYNDQYIVICAFDKFGNKKFQKLEGDNGGLLRNLFYDDEGYLHAQFGRKQIEKKYDQNGNLVSVSELVYSDPDYWNGWEKNATSYSKTVNQTLYCYDYASFLEMIWAPTDVVYIQNGIDKMIIWTSEE